MKRRDFLKICGSGLLAGNWLLKDLWAKDPSVLAVSEGKDYAQITRNVIDALGGMKRFVKSGDVVVVKPNMGWDRKPEFAATTHPLVMRAIADAADPEAAARELREKLAGARG